MKQMKMKEIETVNAAQLSYLTKEPVVSCVRMIAHCYGTTYLKRGEKLDKKAVVSVELFEKTYSHYPIKKAIRSIQKDYLKPGETRSFIMNYPAHKIENSDKPINKVSIPGVIRSFLDDNQINEILHEWNKRYGHTDIIFK